MFNYVRGTIWERFWSKVDIRSPTECWLWLASVSYRGYGFFWDGRKVTAAHRALWEMTHGPIVDKMLVLHKCDNKLCVNPNHLYTGNSIDNVRDAMKAGTIGRKSRFHDGEVWLMRRLKSIQTIANGLTNRFVGEMFKCSEATVRRLTNEPPRN